MLRHFRSSFYHCVTMGVLASLRASNKKDICMMGRFDHIRTTAAGPRNCIKKRWALVYSRRWFCNGIMAFFSLALRRVSNSQCSISDIEENDRVLHRSCCRYLLCSLTVVHVGTFMLYGPHAQVSPELLGPLGRFQHYAHVGETLLVPRMWW